MAQQRFSSMGVVSSLLSAALGCAGVLGIEDATCDPALDARCSSTVTAGNLPQPGGSGGSVAAGGAGAPGSAGAAGAVDGGGAAGNVGQAVGSPAGAGGAEAPPVSGAAGAAAAGAGGVAEAPLCERYCEAVATACTGDDEQYASLDACRAVCSRLEPGSPGDTSGNTVECRLGRARLAEGTGEPADYCYSAGPGGAGVCGDDCEGFCAVMSQACPMQMGSFENCLPLCEAVPNLSGPPDNLTYSTTVQEGNSVQCRLFHVSAATLDPIAHCIHAAGLAPCAATP